MRDHHLYKVWDQVPVTYYQEGVSKNLFQKIWHSTKLQLAKKVISRKAHKKALDIGCASGYMVSEIANSFPDIKFWGVDVYDKAIDYAKAHYPNINFSVAAAEKLPFQDNSFDLVICYETIEHVENPLMSLKEIKRVMSEDGVAIITMDSGNWLFRIVWFVWEKTKGKVWEGAHLHPFHHEELEDMVENSGLKIKEKIFSHMGMEVTIIAEK